MNWSRQWARLVAVMIVMIVACFAAPMAEAHEGHAHHAAAAVADRPLAKSSSGVVVINPVAARATLKMAMADRPGPSLGPASGKTAIGRTTLSRVQADTSQERGCDGHCCSMGSACCSPGMAAQNATTLPPPTKPARLFAGPQPRMTSLAAEALPEPPRSFA